MLAAAIILHATEFGELSSFGLGFPLPSASCILPAANCLLCYTSGRVQSFEFFRTWPTPKRAGKN